MIDVSLHDVDVRRTALGSKWRRAMAALDSNMEAMMPGSVSGGDTRDD